MRSTNAIPTNGFFSQPVKLRQINDDTKKG